MDVMAPTDDLASVIAGLDPKSGLPDFGQGGR
jgi:hypothetical protein